MNSCTEKLRRKSYENENNNKQKNVQFALIFNFIHYTHFLDGNFLRSFMYSLSCFFVTYFLSIFVFYYKLNDEKSLRCWRWMSQQKSLRHKIYFENVALIMILKIFMMFSSVFPKDMNSWFDLKKLLKAAFIEKL